MAERFSHLYKLQNNLYAVDSPVIVAAGALLKDTQTNNVIVQLKFHSISNAIIKALKVGISAFDVAGKELDGVEEYQYLDLNIQNGQEFGSNKAIVMPDPVTRSFAIKGITVVLADGNVKDVSMPITALPTAETLQSALKDPELVKQYKLTCNASAAYAPHETSNLWLCSCGMWNSGSSCIRCREKKANVFSAYDLPSLIDGKDARLREEYRQRKEQKRLAEEKRQEEERQRTQKQAEKDARKKKMTKRLKILSATAAMLIAVVLLYGLWLSPNVIEPSIDYREAEQLLADGKYRDAAMAFAALGDFKDAAKRADEVVIMVWENMYNTGTQMLQNEDFAGALEQFAFLAEHDYKNATEMVMEAKYGLALQYLSNGEDELAFNLFLELRPYADVESYLSNFDFTIATENSDGYTKFYNEKGLISQVSGTSYTYNYEGEIVSENAVAQTYSYDSMDRLIKETYTSEKTNTTISYTYDSKGNLVLEKETGDFWDEDQRLDQTEYEYNDLNQLIWETSYSKYTDRSYTYHWTYAYDQNGNLIEKYFMEHVVAVNDSHWDRLISFYTYEYDESGNCLSEINYEADKQISIEIAKLQDMDAESRFAILGDYYEDSRYTYVYDAENHLVKETWSSGGKDYVTTYSYENGHLVKEERSDNTLVYNYDEFGNLIEVIYSSGSHITYTYTPVYAQKRP